MINNPIEFKTLEAIVMKVLVTKESTRGDDFILIKETLNELGIVNTDSITFKDLMLNHTELKIPSFESITRARRKIQEKEPWLNPLPQIQEARKTEEELAREFFRNE